MTQAVKNFWTSSPSLRKEKNYFHHLKCFHFPKLNEEFVLLSSFLNKGFTSQCIWASYKQKFLFHVLSGKSRWLEQEIFENLFITPASTNQHNILRIGFHFFYLKKYFSWISSVLNGENSTFFFFKLSKFMTWIKSNKSE